MAIQQGLAFDGLHEEALTCWEPEAWPIADDWRPVLRHFLASSQAQQLGQFMRQRLAARAVIYPPQPFHALALTSLAAAKVVILGQDPYHGPGQAQGLAFSVAPGIKCPPSLQNIFKELSREGLMRSSPHDGALARWAQQGVLLLNTCLTVEQGQPASHAKQGWEALTDDIIRAVAQKNEPLVFMLWGAHAQAKQGLIQSVGSEAAGLHLVLTANHPSPLSAVRPPKPFIGGGHFSQANVFLSRQGAAPVVW